MKRVSRYPSHELILFYFLASIAVTKDTVFTVFTSMQQIFNKPLVLLSIIKPVLCALALLADIIKKLCVFAWSKKPD